MSKKISSNSHAVLSRKGNYLSAGDHRNKETPAQLGRPALSHKQNI
jgi:hypothetical protein